MDLDSSSKRLHMGQKYLAKGNPLVLDIDEASEPHCGLIQRGPVGCSDPHLIHNTSVTAYRSKAGIVLLIGRATDGFVIGVSRSS